MLILVLKFDPFGVAVRLPVCRFSSMRARVAVACEETVFRSTPHMPGAVCGYRFAAAAPPPVSQPSIHLPYRHRSGENGRGPSYSPFGAKLIETSVNETDVEILC